ncbi:unnamed protein product, partial [Mesorhabditis belari]|uniref:Saposin B-type domain-containing protein n=1 Tax=Mesorhabditis belari TaxID=2138241 RepID=A0AAF3J8X3_9BILA
MLKLLFLAILAIVVMSQETITCEFCKSGLVTIGKALVSNDALRATMSRQLADNCDSVPQEDMRDACRVVYGQNFDAMLTQIGQNPDAQPASMCQQMGYC